MSMREKIAERIRLHTTDSHWTPKGLTDAVLDELIEPTEGMMGAFHRMCDDNGACLVKPGYQAIIRAAKEGK